MFNNQATNDPSILNVYGMNPIEGTPLFRVLHVTDIHRSPLGRIPSSRTATYFDDCEKENRELASAGAVLGASAITNSGDLFHLKAQSVYYPETLNYHSDLIQELGLPFISIPGNHDMPSSSYEELGKSAYYNVMRQTSNAVDLGTSTDENGRTQLVPKSHQMEITMSNGGKMPISFYGIPYLKRERLVDAMTELNKELAKVGGLKVVLLHGDFFPDDYGNPFFHPIFYSELSALLSHAHIFCLGHIHQSYSVTKMTSPETGQPQLISKPWSMGRVVRDYHASTDVLEHQHKPSFGCITVYEDTNGALAVDIQYGVIPHKGFEASFVRSSVAEEIKDALHLSEYVTQLRQGVTEEMMDPDVFFEKKSEGMSDRVRALIQHHLELAGQ